MAEGSTPVRATIMINTDRWAKYPYSVIFDVTDCNRDFALRHVATRAECESRLDEARAGWLAGERSHRAALLGVNAYIEIVAGRIASLTLDQVLCSATPTLRAARRS